jgi:hypothetical protein
VFKLSLRGQAATEKGRVTMPIEVEDVRRSDGVYAHVLEAFEELELHWLYFPCAPFAMQGQLNDVRAGRPVRVLAPWLPPGTRVGTEVVVVHPDDRIVETDDAWAKQWLEENGL